MHSICRLFDYLENWFKTLPSIWPGHLSGCSSPLPAIWPRFEVIRRGGKILSVIGGGQDQGKHHVLVVSPSIGDWESPAETADFATCYELGIVRDGVEHTHYLIRRL